MNLRKLLLPIAIIAGLILILLSIYLGRNPAFSGNTATANLRLIPVLTLSTGIGILMATALDIANYTLSLSRRRVGTLKGIALSGFSLRRSILRGWPSRLMVQSLSNTVSDSMVAAGVVTSPVLYVSKFVLYSLISAIISVTSSLILFFLFNEPLLFLLNLAPVIILFAPRLVVGSRLGDTVRGVEDELPYFGMFAAVMQSAGLTLYHAFDKIIGNRILRWIEFEGLLVRRENLFFGKTQTGAIEERARQHQSDRFKTYLQGYTSVLKSGGDVARYLDDKTKQFLNWTEFKWKSYADSSSDIGETIIAIFFALPLLIVSIIFVYPQGTVDVLGLTVAVAVPIFTVAAYLAINKAQPRNYDIIVGSRRLALAGGAAAVVALYLLDQPIWVVFAVGIGASATLYGWSTIFQVQEVRKSEEALPQFLRDITEYKKIGYDITKAVQRLARERSYNPIFDRILLDISRQLDIGSRMKEVLVKTRSWLTRIVFFTIGEIVETGGGTPELLESITDFTQRIVIVKKETRSHMRIYEALAYITPVGLAITIALLQFMMKQFTGVVTTGEQAGFLTGFTTFPPLFLDVTKLLIIEAAAAVSFLAAKAIDFTSQNTIRLTVGVIIAVAAILTADAVVLPIFQSL